MKKNAGGIGIERLQLLFSVISRGYEEVSRSASPRYSFEMALLKAAHFEELSPVSELIARLEGLKGRLEGRETGGAANIKAATAKPAPSNPVVYREADKSPITPPSANEAPVTGSYTSPEGSPTVEGFIDYINRRSDVLARTLAAVEISMEGDIINITAGKDSEGLFRVKKDFLENTGAEYFKRRVRINLKKAAAADSKDKEDIGDTLIKDAVRILGGRVIEDRRRTNV